MAVMTTPENPDDANIADTGTFKRFVAHEAEMERLEAAKGSSSALWIVIAAIVLIIAIAVAVWLLTR